MKKIEGRIKESIFILTVSGILIVAFYIFVQNFYYLRVFLTMMFKALSPFIWGFAIAFILIPLRRLIQNKLLKDLKMKEKNKRRLSVALSLVIMVCVIMLFFIMVIPQLISSGMLLLSSLESYMTTIEELIGKLDLQSNVYVMDTLASLEKYVRTELTSILRQVTTTIPMLMRFSVNFVKGVFNFFVSIIIAVYLLTDTERWKRQVNQVIFSVFDKEQGNTINYVGRLTARMFDNFLFGKAIDSFVIAVICGIVCGLLNIPYAILIAVIVGVTNMIPIFGPFIGAIPCIFILLLISPAKALEFVIFVIILQQVDGNLIGPAILGDSMGLPALWVMFAILVGGALFGVVGMLLGVPVFSVFYTIVRDLTAKRIKEKNVELK